jgi:hypothetical protein
MQFSFLNLKPFRQRQPGFAFLLLADVFTYVLLAYLAFGAWSLFQLIWGRHLLGGVALAVWLVASAPIAVWIHNAGHVRIQGLVMLAASAFALSLILGFGIS